MQDNVFIPAIKYVLNDPGNKNTVKNDMLVKMWEKRFQHWDNPKSAFLLLQTPRWKQVLVKFKMNNEYYSLYIKGNIATKKISTQE